MSSLRKGERALFPSLSIDGLHTHTHTMSCLRGRGSYQRVEEEDPEERKHRMAQFLIRKTLEEADHSAARRRSCAGRLKVCRLKVRVRRRLSRLRRTIQVTISGARVCLGRKMVGRIQLWRGVC